VSDGIKVLTLWQPWATLIAEGVKTIETRSWRTNHRGPLAIHAARSTGSQLRATYTEEPCDCGETDCGHSDMLTDDAAARASALGSRGWWPSCGVNELPSRGGKRLPFGTIVATCTLADCVPISDRWSAAHLGSHGGVRSPTKPGRALLLRSARIFGGERDGLWLVNSDGERGWVEDHDLADQLPYGDFTPGRWAWLLADVEPVDPPVPFVGGQGLTKTWERA
jgi:hypothetical protein